ncbi:MAG: thiamine phosphate synthase [Actinobacteria bacterium]|nr:thiamine phosphate synthase [Actinomycetota bacterium]
MTIPSVSAAGARRLARLDDARLQVMCDTTPEDLEAHLLSVTGASADICRLRDDRAGEDDLRAAADVFRRVCDRAATLFLLDRLPGLALQVGADGVLVGAPDVRPDHARRAVGPDLLVGAIVGDAAGIDASADQDIDLLVLDPCDTDLVRYAAQHATHPWFASVAGVEEAARMLQVGAARLSAPSRMDDPGAHCWALRRALSAHGDR